MRLLWATKKTEINVVFGDFNVEIGRGAAEVAENYGFGDRNDREDILIQFCLKEELCYQKQIL